MVLKMDPQLIPALNAKAIEALATVKERDRLWVVDSGAGGNMASNARSLDEILVKQPDVPIQSSTSLADGVLKSGPLGRLNLCFEMMKVTAADPSMRSCCGC